MKLGISYQQAEISTDVEQYRWEYVFDLEIDLYLHLPIKLFNSKVREFLELSWSFGTTYQSVH